MKRIKRICFYKSDIGYVLPNVISVQFSSVAQLCPTL